MHEFVSVFYARITRAANMRQGNDDDNGNGMKMMPVAGVSGGQSLAPRYLSIPSIGVEIEVMPVDMVSSGQIKTQGAVFRNLYKVEVGDTIALWQHHQRYLYRVDAVQILPEHGESLEVPAENAVCRDETGFERLTLVSCWPEWSNTYCVVVTASLLRTADSR